MTSDTVAVVFDKEGNVSFEYCLVHPPTFEELEKICIDLYEEHKIKIGQYVECTWKAKQLVKSGTIKLK